MPDKHLTKQFNLVVTRPLEQGKSLITKLAQLEPLSPIDFSIQHLPLIKLAPISFKLENKQLYDGIIFISSSAVENFYSQANTKDTPLFAVGDNTASKIQLITGRKAIYPEQMNSEGLLQLEPLQAVAGQNWLIVKGEGGRDTIKNVLQNRGALVETLDVYQREICQSLTQASIVKAEVSLTQKPIWLISSGQALTNLHDLLKESKHLNKTQIIVSSDRIKKQAKQLGFKIVAQSTGASENQLVQCVKSLIERS